MKVALIGGTGLVGSLLASRLATAGHELHLLQRRPGGAAGSSVHVHIAPASSWPRIVGAIAPDAVVSALGTTMKQAGSREAFRRVDHDHILDFARAARVAGARHMAVVSSVGADSASRNFYLRTKGETEDALAKLGFESFDIFRPGLLLGNRGSDRRLGEGIGILLSPLAKLALRGRLDRFAAIDAATVAAAMASTLCAPQPGTHRHENRAIRHLARC